MEKNILENLILFSVAISIPALVFAQTQLKPPLEATSFEGILDNLISFALNIAIVIVPLAIVYAAYLFITAGGNMDKINQAKNMIIWSIAGVLIILLSKGILAIIKQILGVA